LQRPWRVFVEWIRPGEACLREVKRVYASIETGVQSIDVLELDGVGKSLVIDGKLQSSLSDEEWYHEALVHPVMLAHPCPRDVLVLGGGEGATAREVLKHRCTRRVVMVDVDAEMIEIARKLLVEWHRGAFTDPRLDVVAAEGRAFLEAVRPESFDAIILDLVDPTESGPAARLYTVEFYRLVYRALRSPGVMVTQATSPSLTPEVFQRIYSAVRHVFGEAVAYVTYVRSYNGLWGFVAAGKKVDFRTLTPAVVEEELAKRVEGELRFYDPTTHVWLFTLPKPVRKLLEEEVKPATDQEPAFLPA
jgi:spermidine synthase